MPTFLYRFIFSPIVALSLFVFSPVQGQNTVEEVSVAQLEELLKPPKSGVRVLNFWATWCRPCVAELPHFDHLGEKYKAQGAEMWLLSLDDPSDLAARVQPFVTKRKVKSRVGLLTEPDLNVWGRKLAENWQGNIPVTLFIHADGRREFVDGAMTEEALENKINSFLP